MRLPRLTRRGVLFTALGIGAYAVFLVAGVPASFAYQYLAPQGKPGAGGVQLSGISGTVWSGAVASAQLGGMPVGRLEWDLNVLQLPLGRVSADVQMRRDDTRLSGRVSRSLGGTVRLGDVVARLPAQSLLGLTARGPLSYAGQIAADIEQAELTPGEAFVLRGRLSWQGAGLAAPQRVDFGDLLLTFEPAATGSKAVLADQGGPLQAEGTLEIQPSGQYTLNAKLASREPGQTPLNTALAVLGRPDAQGKVTFRHAGKIW